METRYQLRHTPVWVGVLANACIDVTHPRPNCKILQV